LKLVFQQEETEVTSFLVFGVVGTTCEYSKMVHFEITPRIRNALNKAVQNEQVLSREDRSNFSKYNNPEEKSIPFAVVMKLAEFLQQNGDNLSPTQPKKKKNKQVEAKFFHDLVEGSNVVDPSVVDYSKMTVCNIE
jgi:hypothetical protein